MTATTAQHSQVTRIEPVWRCVGSMHDLIAGSGVCALFDGDQVALFYLPDSEPGIYAIGNFDPIGGAQVLSRGIIGTRGSKLVVASPLYKHHYCLRSGVCLEDPKQQVPVYRVRLRGNDLWLARPE